MLPVIRLGPVVLQLPGLVLLAGLWFAISAMEKEAKRLKLDAEAIIKILAYAGAAGLVSARLVFAARRSEIYLANPLGLLALDAGTLDLAGGILVGAVVAFILGRRHLLPLRSTLDALAPGLAVLAISVGGAHLLSGEAYGNPTALPWGIDLWGARRLPTQVFEIAAAAAVFAAWGVSARRVSMPGAAFLLWLTLQSAAVILLATFRADVAIWAAGIRATQVVALALVAAGLVFAIQWRRADAGKAGGSQRVSRLSSPRTHQRS